MENTQLYNDGCLETMGNLIELIEKLQSEIEWLNKEETKVISVDITSVSHYVTVHLMDTVDNLKFMNALPEEFEFEAYGEDIRYIKINNGIQYLVLKSFEKEDLEGKELETYAKEIMFREEFYE